MRKHLLGGLIAGATLAAMTYGATASDTRFTVHNNSVHAMLALFAPHISGTNFESGDWGPNLLYKAMQPGESRIIDVDSGHRWCRFHLHAEFKGRTTADAYNFNACAQDDWFIYDVDD
jgi:hypothetical protein